MRAPGTSEQLAARRTRALDLLAEGSTPTQAARETGVARQTIYRWKAKRKQHQEAERVGRPSRLGAEQMRQLESELKQGAYAHGYAEDYWTLDRIGRLIWDVFGVRYHPSGVWHLMKRLGWSCQKPQRRGLQRHDATVAHWKRYVWPGIKKVARPARDPGVRR